MLTEPLPATLDIRKAAARGVGISGVLKPLDLQRFRALLASDDGSIQVDLAFSRDEEDRFLVRAQIEADVVVTCQRCLETMPEHVSADNTLAVVWTDQQAAALPRQLDPLVVEEQSCNLWELVEDELILALKPFSYHDTQTCSSAVTSFAGPAVEDDGASGKPNPFDVLAQLKPGAED